MYIITNPEEVKKLKIEIHKVNGKSSILLDGRPVEAGCMGFDITSAGANGFATVTLKFITKNLDFSADVDEPITEARGTQRLTGSLR